MVGGAGGGGPTTDQNVKNGFDGLQTLPTFRDPKSTVGDPDDGGYWFAGGGAGGGTGPTTTMGVGGKGGGGRNKQLPLHLDIMVS